MAADFADSVVVVAAFSVLLVGDSEAPVSGSLAVAAVVVAVAEE